MPYGKEIKVVSIEVLSGTYARTTAIRKAKLRNPGWKVEGAHKTLVRNVKYKVILSKRKKK